MAETQAVSPPHDVTNPYASPQSLDDSFDTHADQGPMGHGLINADRALRTAWELFKVNVALLVGAHLVLMVINIVASGISTFAQVAVASAQGEESAAAILLNVFTSVAINLLQMFLGIGIVRINLNVGQGKPAEIGMLFSGGRYFLRIVGGSILYGLLVFIGSVALIIPGIYLALKYWPFYYFIVDRDYGVGEAISLAGEYTMGNKFRSIRLWLMWMGLSILGLLMFCVGFIFTVPIASLTWALGFLMMTNQQVHQPDRISV